MFWDLHREIERALNVPVRPMLLRAFVALGSPDIQVALPVPAAAADAPIQTLAEFTRDAQREYLIKIITAANGKTSAALKILDISPATFYRHLDDCGIKIAEIKSAARAARADHIQTKRGTLKPIARDSIASGQTCQPVRGGNPIVIDSVDFSTESVRFRRNNHVERRPISWLTKNFGVALEKPNP